MIMINTKKIRSVRRLFKKFNKDYYKPIKILHSFDGKKNSYIEYISRGNKYNNLSLEEYLNMIRPYLKHLINDHRIPIKVKDHSGNESQFGKWKNQLIMLNNCISSKYFEETRSMYSPSTPVQILMGSETDNIIDELFKILLQRFQEAREISNDRGSEFIHESVGLLYYYFHKIDLKRGNSYIKSTERLKNKRATINPKINDDNCFQYALTVALNHQNIERYHQRISKIEPFINQYNWKDIDFPSHQKDWKKFEQNNETIALNILFVPHNTKQIRHAYKSKYNNKRENQVILLMITDGEKWYYLAFKSERTFYGGKWCNRARY